MKRGVSRCEGSDDVDDEEEEDEDEDDDDDHDEEMVVVVVAGMMIMVIARVRIKLLKWSPFIRACSVNLWNKMGHDCHQDKQHP